jgi:formylglycine-generating enzyme required for sulfatase activity
VPLGKKGSPITRKREWQWHGAMQTLLKNVESYVRENETGTKTENSPASRSAGSAEKLYTSGWLEYLVEDETTGVKLPVRVVFFKAPSVGMGGGPVPGGFGVFGTTAKTRKRSTRSVTNSIRMSFLVIPAGRFMMGSPRSESGRASGREELQHPVTLTRSFLLGKYEVTQKQFETVMETNPSRFKSPDHPVEQVSWKLAKRFCERLSALPAERSVGNVYRLPTEAEWEYACRAGTISAYSFGDRIRSTQGSYSEQEVDVARPTRKVGSGSSNRWGLYDMHGNVWEWCQDYFGPYPSGSVTNPTGPSSGTHHVFRGGSSSVLALHCRSAVRGEAASNDGPNPSSFQRFEKIGDFGLRVVLERKTGVAPRRNR